MKINFNLKNLVNLKKGLKKLFNFNLTNSLNFNFKNTF